MAVQFGLSGLFCTYKFKLSLRHFFVGKVTRIKSTGATAVPHTFHCNLNVIGPQAVQVVAVASPAFLQYACHWPAVRRRGVSSVCCCHEIGIGRIIVFVLYIHTELAQTVTLRRCGSIRKSAAAPGHCTVTLPVTAAAHRGLVGQAFGLPFNAWMHTAKGSISSSTYFI
jgi:hypothetical protein